MTDSYQDPGPPPAPQNNNSNQGTDGTFTELTSSPPEEILMMKGQKEAATDFFNTDDNDLPFYMRPYTSEQELVQAKQPEPTVVTPKK